MIEIIRAGMATTFQDRGRPGLAHIGVGAAGSVDLRLAALVNRLVGNSEEAAVIETTGNLEVGTTTPTVIATSDELAPVLIRPGQSVVVRTGAHGRLWHYLAVRGGFDVEAVLGSRSSDTMSGLGPRPPSAGDRVEVGDSIAPHAAVDQAPVPELPQLVRLLPGPRRDWFTDASWAALFDTTWTVTATSRIGVRLTGAALERSVGAELPSEGLVRGAIQVPSGGEPVMMAADHPTTGGYPVIAVVHPDDVAIAAQRSSGTSIRFRR